MILYHYCTTEAFCSIVDLKSIWLSSLSISNDTMEGIWLAKVFGTLCMEKRISGVVREQLIPHVSDLAELFDGLGFCLSEDGDMLSQWRGYAGNAAGMCIGFSDEYVHGLSKHRREGKESGFQLLKVEYDLESQKELIHPVFERLMKSIDLGAFISPTSLLGSVGLDAAELKRRNSDQAAARKQFSRDMTLLFPHLFRLKNPAFSEEREWRMVSFLIRSRDDCQFRALSDRIIPYRQFDLIDLGVPPIVEVILGPKNITNIDVIKLFLDQRGFKDVEVRRSEATYR